MKTDRSREARRQMKMRWKFERNSPEYTNQKHCIFDDRRTKRQRTRTDQLRAAIDESLETTPNQYELEELDEEIWWKDLEEKNKKIS